MVFQRKAWGPRAAGGRAMWALDGLDKTEFIKIQKRGTVLHIHCLAKRLGFSKDVEENYLD